MTTARAFRGYRFPAEVILWAVRGSCSSRSATATSSACSPTAAWTVDHTTMYRWVQRFAPESEAHAPASPAVPRAVARR